MKPTASIVFNDPCIRCGKSIRADYKGLCMDCADVLGVSEINNPSDPNAKELELIKKLRKNIHVRTNRNHPGE